MVHRYYLKRRKIENDTCVKKVFFFHSSFRLARKCWKTDMSHTDFNKIARNEKWWKECFWKNSKAHTKLATALNGYQAPPLSLGIIKKSWIETEKSPTNYLEFSRNLIIMRDFGKYLTNNNSTRTMTFQSQFNSQKSEGEKNEIIIKKTLCIFFLAIQEMQSFSNSISVSSI